MSGLVKKLSQGDHPVEVRMGPKASAKTLKECIDRGYVQVRFTDTDGGTELGIQLDKHASNLNADFEKGVGLVKLVGNLTLDYVRVQCEAEVDLLSFTGKGHLIPM